MIRITQTISTKMHTAEKEITIHFCSRCPSSSGSFLLPRIGLYVATSNSLKRGVSKAIRSLLSDPV